MRNEQVTCDGCGRDLTTRTNCEDYRLVLAAESKPGSGAGFYTAMAIAPAVDRAHHFCGLDCLDIWRSREIHYKNLWRDHSEKTCVKLPVGISFTPTSGEERNLLNKEFRDAALVAFPMNP